MPKFITIINRYINGDLSLSHAFLASLSLLVTWSVLAICLIEWLGSSLTIAHYVWLINALFFCWGVLAIYSASVTSHVISHSFIGKGAKFLARFMNFIVLFIGIVLIILVSSGEVSWMTYLANGIHS